MAVPFGGIEVKLCGKVLGRDFCLVFHYIMQGVFQGNQVPHDNPAITQAPAFAEIQSEFRTGFNTAVRLPLRAIMSTETEIQTALFDYRIAGVAPQASEYSGGGLAAGTPLPAFTAMSFVSPPVARPFKRASKRVPGITETMWTGSGIDATFADEIEEVEFGFGQRIVPLQALANWTDVEIVPVVVRRVAYVNQAGKSVFGVPDDYLLWQYAPTAGQYSLRGIGTQNSRKD